VIVAFALPASAAANLREQDIVELVKNEAVTRLQVSKRDVEVEWQDMKLDSLVPSLPDGRVTLQIAQTARLGGRGSVPVQILVNGQKYRTIFPRMDVRVFETVLVAKTRIARGSFPSEREVALSRQALTPMIRSPLTGVEQVIGAEATRDIQPGTVLQAPMFRIPPLVKAGDEVSVVLVSGGLTLITKGQARSAGAKGQLVKVLNLESRQEFVARVTGPNRVEIRMEE
jgi:flagella basal body P-ring formation protein FlgA